jgi:hypothetical protein
MTGDILSVWRTILQSQNSADPPRLSVDDAVVLYDSADINELMHAAMLRRRSQVPSNEVTYLVDRNVNYTNVSTINCQFCSFYRPPGHPETYTQSTNEISDRLCVGLRMSGWPIEGAELAIYSAYISVIHIPIDEVRHLITRDLGSPTQHRSVHQFVDISRIV